MADSIRLYLDEDAMRTSIVRALRARQVDVLTVFEAELIGRSDEENLEYACSQNRTLFSFNRGDFARLHKAYLDSGRHHSGIVVSDQLETGAIVRRLFKLLHTRFATEMQDRLEYLSNWR
jgi:hypothetical protein